MLKALFAQAGFGTICLATASLGLFAGCDGGGEPDDPHEKVNVVREAFDAPTGTVDATTVAELNQLNALSASLSSIIAASSYGYSGSACYDGSLTEGSVDLACATKDFPEGQQLTGTITVSAEASGGFTSIEAFASMTYEDVCDATRCVSGVIATDQLVEAENIQSTIAISLDVTEGGQTTHIFWGTDVGISEQSGVSAKIAMWDSQDHSFVLESSVTQEGVSFSVTGANGTFSCTATAEGGSCTGAGEIKF